MAYVDYDDKGLFEIPSGSVPAAAPAGRPERYPAQVLAAHAWGVDEANMYMHDDNMERYLNNDLDMRSAEDGYTPVHAGFALWSLFIGDDRFMVVVGVPYDGFAKLTDEQRGVELTRIGYWVTGQNSDGLGEGLEGMDFRMPDGSYAEFGLDWQMDCEATGKSTGSPVGPIGMDAFDAPGRTWTYTGPDWGDGYHDGVRFAIIRYVGWMSSRPLKDDGHIDSILDAPDE